MELVKKYCHAELGSASTLYMGRFRNEFGMTLCDELISLPSLLFNKADAELNSA